MSKYQEPMSNRDSEEFNQITKDSEMKFNEMLLIDNDSQLKSEWPFKVGPIGHFKSTELDEITKLLMACREGK